MGSKCSNFTKCTKCAKDLRNEPSRKEAEFERNQEIESSLKESLIHFSLDDSLLTIEKIINKYSNNPEVLLKVACHLHDKKKIGESKEIFEKILGEGDPLDLKSAVSYIKIHIQEKKYEIGRVMVEEYLERFPESDQLFYLLAEIYSIQNESGLAKASIKKALKLDPDNPEYHNVYGLSLMKDKKYEKALKEFEKAFELDQFMAKAMNNAGNAYRKLGNTSEAIKCYNNAIDLVPKRKFPIALINLATTCFYTGDVLSTLNFFEEALQTGSNIHKIMVKKGYHLLFKNPKTKQAIESLLKHEVNKSILLFHEILKNDPNNPVVTFYLASALLKQNKINEAHDMFRNCIENGQKTIFLNMQFVKHYVKRANVFLNTLITKQPCAEIPEVDEDSENSTINVATFEVFKVRAESLLSPYHPRNQDSDSPLDTSIEEDDEKCIVV